MYLNVSALWTSYKMRACPQGFFEIKIKIDDDDDDDFSFSKFLIEAIYFCLGVCSRLTYTVSQKKKRKKKTKMYSHISGMCLNVVILN